MQFKTVTIPCLILTLLTCQLGLAENFRSPITSLECPEVDLEPAFNEKGFPDSRNKKNQELSYPVAAARLLDFHDSDRLKTPTSPIVLALESHTATHSVEAAIQTAQKNGTCAENSRLQKELDRELVEKPEQFMTEFHDILNKNPSEFNLTQIFSQRTQNESECKTCATGQPNLESNAIKVLENSTAFLDRKKVILKILEKTATLCSGPNRNHFNHLPNPTVKQISNTAELYGAVQDRLGSGSPSRKQPLALNVCKPFLDKGRAYSGISRKPAENQSVSLGQSSECADPSDSLAVAVFGSRRDLRTGNCELKIKTPWGNSCKDYSSEWPCKDGDVWVDIETLGRNTSKVIYLNP